MPGRAPHYLAKKRKYLIPCVYHFYKKPMVLKKGRGVYLYDDTGKRYLDAYSGVGVVNCGHCHPKITAAAASQLKRLQHTTTIYVTEPLLDLAEALSRFAGGGLKRSFFCTSGSEANEGAMRLAKLHTGRTQFIALEGSLHGRTYLTTAATGLPFWRTDPDPPAGFHFLPNPPAVEDLEKAMRRYPGRIAAMIVEPVQGNGGIRPLPEGYLKKIKKALNRHGALLILDEAQTGFGRTGKKFAYLHENAAPDILTVCKALGNGLPISAFMTTDRIAEAYRRPGASTFGGNQVCARAALETLKTLQAEKLDRRAERMGGLLKEFLLRLKGRTPWIREIRGLGLMLGAEFARPGDGAPASVELDLVLEKLKESGVLAGKTGKDRNVLTFMPPLVIREKHVRFIASRLERVLAKTGFLMLIFLSLLLPGCATLHGQSRRPDKISTVSRLIEQYAAGDARYLQVKEREYLVFDDALKARLSDYGALAGADQKKEFLVALVTDAKALGDAAVELELKRIPSSEPEAASGRLLESYKNESASRLALEIQKIRVLASEAELDRYRRDLEANVRRSIKTRGRTMRQLLFLPLAPFVQAWMGFHILSTPHEAPRADFEKLDVYRPETPPAQTEPAQMDDWQLLEYYAPVIAVEKKEKVSYDPEADRFGRVRMDGESAAEAQPKVAADDPAVYAYAETKSVQGAPVKRLVYTLWFPERPRLGGGFDPEVGSMQGSILRVSLDESSRPLVYENVSSCGCYYKIFPAEALERRAAEIYRSPLEGKRFALENKVPGKIDAAVPALVPALENGRSAAVLYSAGTHEVMRVAAALPASAQAASERTYRLLRYEELESLPFNGVTLSLFDQNGLVRNAARLEATLLAPSGMYSAGTPRQRGTLMIYFDQADFDDPRLLETYLRLPEHAFKRSA